MGPLKGIFETCSVVGIVSALLFFLCAVFPVAGSSTGQESFVEDRKEREGANLSAAD